jgi:hypothetical protein
MCLSMIAMRPYSTSATRSSPEDTLCGFAWEVDNDFINRKATGRISQKYTI